MPGSKELLPVGFHLGPEGNPRPKPLSQYLLSKMRRAGTEEIHVILSKGKWDIPTIPGTGSEEGFRCAVDCLGTSGADIVLGVLPAPETEAADVIEVDAEGSIVRLEPKDNHPVRTDCDWTYVLATWRPAFAEFLCSEVRRLGARARAHAGDEPPEWPVGAVIAAAQMSPDGSSGRGGRSVHAWDIAGRLDGPAKRPLST